VGPFIQARIERYAASEIRFNLMAVIRDRRAALAEELARLEARRAALQAPPAEEGPAHLL
jgi:ubiquitin carboxyl-terminal hydrolase L5